MPNQTENFTRVGSGDIYTQGGMANHTGSMNEMSVNDSLRAIGLFPEKRTYESLWSTTRLSQVDCDLADLNICAEYKYQEVSGTCDQKGASELYSAGQTLVCDDYVLVFSGPHWEKPRGAKLYKMYKDIAKNYNKHSDTFCVAAKRLHVMKRSEFIEFVAQRKKEKLQNG
tara:strand:- start:146 stop:655 length:510 start_codon:yes stop_codon:yes gene_type:complete